MRLLKVLLYAGIFLYSLMPQANAAAVFWGPSPYLSAADIPTGFYAGGAPVAIEDFEDDSLDFGISASAGSIIDADDRFPLNDVDSVDADDGLIDGSGSLGRSWYQPEASDGVTFTFTSPFTAAGIVWTDSLRAPIIFEAFDINMESLGVSGPFTLGDSVFTGTTAEDRFFGVQDSNGILAINITALTDPNTSGLEVDHVQFGNAVPLPATLPMFASGLVILASLLIRKKKHNAFGSR
jgi:hypothetical protein